MANTTEKLLTRRKTVLFREQEKNEDLKDICLEILAHSRNELYLALPFLDRALAGLRPFPDPAVRPSGTDGEILFFHPRGIAGLFRTGERSLNRTYLHTLLHCLFGHPFYPFPESRPKAASEDAAIFPPDVESLPEAKDDPALMLWHLSCDITAESILDGLYLPCVQRSKSALRQRLYEELRTLGMVVTPQAVFQWLTEKALPQKELLSLISDFTSDDHRYWKPDSTRARQQQTRWEEIRSVMQIQMETFAKEASRDAKGLYSQLAVENRKRYDYRRFLRKFSLLREEMQVDPDSFDYIYYHYGLTHYGNLPLVEPLETKEVRRVEELAIVIDTSMSCDGHLVRAFLEQTYSILMEQETYSRIFHIRIIQCDERVQKDTLITSQEEMQSYMKDFTVVGKGGTDFRPAFAYVDHLQKSGDFHHLRGLLYFTDGYGIYPVRKPVYDVAFLFMREDYQDVDVPPWAMKLILDPEELARGTGNHSKLS